MKLSTCFLGATLVTSASAAKDMSVKVTEGPTECDIFNDSVRAGKYVSVKYSGYIDESSETGVKGFKFDSNENQEDTFNFTVGKGKVIRGMDEGLIGLCKGAKATLILPPDYGYGTEGAFDDVPGGATLRFDVEVVNLTDPPAEANVFAMIDKDGDGRITKSEVEAYFGKAAAVPPGVWENNDKDGDGIITWEEFTGPKGDVDPSKEEL